MTTGSLGPTPPPQGWGPPLTALQSVLQMIGQYGLPLVLSVVLIAYLLFSVDRTQRQQAVAMEQLANAQTQLASTMVRMATAIDLLNTRLSQGSGTNGFIPAR